MSELSSTPQNVLILMAMSAEAAPLISRLNLSPLPPSQDASLTPPYPVYTGVHGPAKHSITLITSGTCATHGVDRVGTLHAGLMTMYALRELGSPAAPFTLVLNAGTCGGFIRSGMKIGSIVMPHSAAFHDRRIVIPGTAFEPYGRGLSSAAWSRSAAARKELGFGEGVCTTGDSLDHCAADDLEMEKNGAAVKDMEHAAIMEVCGMLNAAEKLVGIKVVTDLVDGDRPSFEEFLENLSTAASELQKAIIAFLDFL
jgi:5'-methylthioadenosine nucleosidase